AAGRSRREHVGGSAPIGCGHARQLSPPATFTTSSEGVRIGPFPGRLQSRAPGSADRSFKGENSRRRLPTCGGESATLRADLHRFAFLLGQTDDEELFGAPCASPRAPGPPSPRSRNAFPPSARPPTCEPPA